MAGISSKAVNFIPNKDKTFQGQQQDDEFQLNWVQFKWRNHDPQIGRFVEIDPLSDKFVHNSIYAFSENKVIGHIELEGLESLPVNQKTAAESIRNRLNFQSYGGAISQTGGRSYQSGTYKVPVPGSSLSLTRSESKPLINDPRVTVQAKNPADGLQIIQVVNATSVPGGTLPDGQSVQQLRVGGVTRTAFVDGGINSPAGESVSGQPYYNTSANLKDVNYANATWDQSTSSGAITAFDVPTASELFSEISFETYFVLTNFNGSGMDKIVGAIIWGYHKDASGNLVPTGNTQVTTTNEFSPTAKEIINNDYPNYQTHYSRIPFK